MRIFISLTFLAFTSFHSVYASDWTGMSECGKYQVAGVARLLKSGPAIVLNEKSNSELTINPQASSDNFKLAPYIDKPMVAIVLISKANQGSSLLGSVLDIKFRVPNPINPMDTGSKKT